MFLKKKKQNQEVYQVYGTPSFTIPHSLEILWEHWVLRIFHLTDEAVFIKNIKS